jgi:nitrite reductase/ring-hydroxylating ferredoxin subunit/uncharacterized membrane protein
MARAWPEAITGWIERWAALDAAAEPAQRAARRLIPQGSRLKDALSGTWLGHPVHPPLTDVVVGAWTSALALDLAGGERAAPAADGLVALGVAAALPTAAAGASDWAELLDRERRLGALHAAGNSAALALHALSWRERARGRRSRGRALSAAGWAIASCSAWLGGHLSFRRGVGVDQTVFEPVPEDWTPVFDEAALEEGALTPVDAAGAPVLLVRQGGTIHAMSDTCSHRGCALHEGELAGGVVRCPCHGSEFRLDGALLRGPATAPQPAYAVRVRAGVVEIRGA